MQGMDYIVNMPCELLMDGYVAYLNSRKETRKLQKDRHLRNSLVLLYAALEAELNRQLNITTYNGIDKIDKNLEKVLDKKRVSNTEKQVLSKEMDYTIRCGKKTC